MRNFLEEIKKYILLNSKPRYKINKKKINKLSHDTTVNTKQ